MCSVVHLNCDFECEGLIQLYNPKLTNKKLPDNNLASELVEKRTVESWDLWGCHVTRDRVRSNYVEFLAMRML